MNKKIIISLVVVLLLVVSAYLIFFASPRGVAKLVLQVNPTITLTLDAQNRVIDAEGLDAQGEALLAELQISNPKPLLVALRLIAGALSDAGQITNERRMFIALRPVRGRIKTEALAILSDVARQTLGGYFTERGLAPEIKTAVLTEELADAVADAGMFPADYVDIVTEVGSPAVLAVLDMQKELGIDPTLFKDEFGTIAAALINMKEVGIAPDAALAILNRTFTADPTLEELTTITQVIDKINIKLDKADVELGLAWDAIDRRDYEIVEIKTYNARFYIDTAFKYYRTIEDKLTEDERTHWLTHFELYRTDFDLTLNTIDWFNDNDELIRLLDGDINERLMTTFELHTRRTEELGEKWNNHANNIEFIQRTQPDFGITDIMISDAREWTSIFEESAKEFHTSLDELKTIMPNFIPIEDRIISPIVIISPVSEEIIPSDLARFFDSFDLDGNGEIDLGESQDFFYWVEANIVYRFDYENEQNPGGSPVGDGRKGRDFVQTPHETWMERAGDCEDMAIIQVAFFNHFGIPTYIASVNAQGREIDHAIAIVAIGGTPEEFADMLGELVYYEIDGLYYMLVDNAYSNAFGFLCGGLREGQFYIIKKLTLEEEMYKHRGI